MPIYTEQETAMDIKDLAKVAIEGRKLIVSASTEGLSTEGLKVMSFVCPSSVQDKFAQISGLLGGTKAGLASFIIESWITAFCRAVIEELDEDSAPLPEYNTPDSIFEHAVSILKTSYGEEE